MSQSAHTRADLQPAEKLERSGAYFKPLWPQQVADC